MAIRILLSKKLGELRWTQADLARKTGIRPSTINEMYHEIIERVNLEHLDLICEALDCDLSEILVRIPNEVPKLGNRSRAGETKTEMAPLVGRFSLAIKKYLHCRPLQSLFRDISL
ncbi:MAG: putative transcriptional regulator [Clostridiales bacterium]|nr:putative transcriptional regulator [Clostridiales bacterium]